MAAHSPQEINLEELLDIPNLQHLLELLYRSSGIPSAIIDLKGNVLTGSGWQSICVDFHRKHPECLKKCVESDIQITRQIKEGEKYAISQCPNGLIDTATPIIVRGQHIGNVFTGQFLWEPPNIEFFQVQALRYGFNLEEYIEAVKKIPIFPKQKTLLYLDFLVEFAKILTSMAYSNIERIEAEKSKIKAQKLESVALLAGGIAHDFNNLLVGVMGNIGLLKEDQSLSNEQKDIIDELEFAAFRSRDLAKQLLTFSKGGDPIRKPFDIRDTINNAASLMLHGSKCIYSISFAPDLPLVFGDESQISQTINNLILNARQAMNNGGQIKIAVSTLNDSNDIENFGLNPVNRYLKISIEDNGPGIPNDVQNHIFEPYYTTKPHGSGLGLAISYSIIKKHNGEIKFQSSLGEGTVFHIYLPVAGEFAENKLDHDENDLNFTGHVLIIDDNAGVHLTLGKMLMKLGFTYESAYTDLEAFEKFESTVKNKKKYQFCVVDLTIPGSEGGEVIFNRLKEQDPNLIGFVSSGYSESIVMAHYMDFGFKDALPKPYTYNEVKKLVKKYFI